jgi:hypothetical protein
MAYNDSKSIFNSTNNRGLATILDNTGILKQADQMEARAARKALEEQERRKRKEDQAEKLKNAESWRYYTPALSEQYKGILDDLKGDKIDIFTAQSRLAEYADSARASMQMQAEFKDAQADWAKNSKVQGAEQWFIDKYHSDPSLDGLKKAQQQGVNRYGFLDEEGGSQYINTTQAFKDVIDKSLDGWVEKELSNPGAKSVVARGLMQFKENRQSSKLRSYAEVDPKTGEIMVKDIDKLFDAGVVNLFTEDPYTGRVLEDRALALQAAAEKTGQKISIEEAKGVALREILKPYGSQGKVTNEDVVNLRNFSSPSASGSGGGSRGSKEDSPAERLYKVFKSRGAGQGFTEGEERTYTQEYLNRMGIRGDAAKKLLGKKFFQSDELKGLKMKDGTTFGRIIYRPGENRSIARVEIIGKPTPYTDPRTGEKKFKENRTWQELSLSQLQKSLDKTVYKEIEEIARGEGRLDEFGNFIFGNFEEEVANTLNK